LGNLSCSKLYFSPLSLAVAVAAALPSLAILSSAPSTSICRHCCLAVAENLLLKVRICRTRSSSTPCSTATLRPSPGRVSSRGRRFLHVMKKLRIQSGPELRSFASIYVSSPLIFSHQRGEKFLTSTLICSALF
jgi:hypothetical protein